MNKTFRIDSIKLKEFKKDDIKGCSYNENIFFNYDKTWKLRKNVEKKFDTLLEVL